MGRDSHKWAAQYGQTRTSRVGMLGQAQRHGLRCSCRPYEYAQHILLIHWRKTWQGQPGGAVKRRLDESGARHMEGAANPPDRKLETRALAMPCVLIVPSDGRWPGQRLKNPGDCAP